MKNKQLPLQDHLELFRAMHKKRHEETGRKHLGSRAHLKATRKFYGQVLRDYGKSTSMEDQMNLESIRDARKSVSKQLDPNFLKRNTKALVRWSGRQLLKAGKVAVKGIGRLLGAKPSQQPRAQYNRAPQMRVIKDLPGIREMQPQTGKKVAAGAKKTVAAKNSVSAKKSTAPAVKLDRSLARAASRTVEQPSQSNRMSVS